MTRAIAELRRHKFAVGVRMSAIYRLRKSDTDRRSGLYAISGKSRHPQRRQSDTARRRPHRTKRRGPRPPASPPSDVRSSPSSDRARARQRHRRQPEVASPVIGANVEQPVSVVGEVLVLVLPLGNQRRYAGRVIGGKKYCSAVVWLADSSSRYLPSRVFPAPISKRSSLSS